MNPTGLDLLLWYGAELKAHVTAADAAAPALAALAAVGPGHAWWPWKEASSSPVALPFGLEENWRWEVSDCSFSRWLSHESWATWLCGHPCMAPAGPVCAHGADLRFLGRAELPHVPCPVLVAPRGHHRDNWHVRCLSFDAQSPCPHDGAVLASIPELPSFPKHTAGRERGPLGHILAQMLPTKMSGIQGRSLLLG